MEAFAGIGSRFHKEIARRKLHDEKSQFFFSFSDRGLSVDFPVIFLLLSLPHLVFHEEKGELRA